MIAGLEGFVGDAVVDGVEFGRWEARRGEQVGELAAAGDDGARAGKVFENDTAPGGHAEILMDIGALGDGDDGEPAIGEMEGSAGIGKNPGTEDDVEVTESAIKSSL